MRTLLSRTQSVRPDDVDGMMAAIAREVRLWRGGHPRNGRRADVIAPYEAGRLTEDLVAVFERTRQAGEAGTARVPRSLAVPA